MTRNKKSILALMVEKISPSFHISIKDMNEIKRLNDSVKSADSLIIVCAWNAYKRINLSYDICIM